MKEVYLILLIASALYISGCLETQNSPNTTVDVKNGSFIPSSISVPAGTTITWANHNGSSIKIVGEEGSFSSDDIPNGYKFRHTFLDPGTYQYHLEGAPSIKGTVVVTSKGASQSQGSNASNGNISGNTSGSAVGSAPGNESGNASPGPSGSPAKSVTIDLTAKNMAFSTSTITVPAGAQVTVNFDNQDSGVPHNLAVYETSSAKKSIFVGDIITGPKKTTYTFKAPSKPGTYFFRCDVHPSQMTGSFIVR
jgi:plastocyanin